MSNNHFVGSYVGDLRDVMIAAAVSGQNVMLMGAPGYGKTAVSLDVAARAAGDKFAFVRLDPTTPVDAVAGAFDPAAMLDGRIERVTDGTPYEPGTRIVILDELFRASEPMFDKLLDVADRKDLPRGERPVVIGTSNFAVENDRTEALIDRFAIWYWVDASDVDISAVMRAQFAANGEPTTPGTVPTWDEIETVRGFSPSESTVDVVIRWVENLRAVCEPEGYHLHPRRANQWRELVYRVSAYEYGAADFDSVSPMAARIMRFAWSNMTPTAAGEWATIVAATVDAVGAAVDEIISESVVRFRNVAAMPPSQRNAALVELGTFNVSKQETLRELARNHGDDPRIDAAIANITAWFGLAASGRADSIG